MIVFVLVNITALAIASASPTVAAEARAKGCSSQAAGHALRLEGEALDAARRTLSFAPGTSAGMIRIISSNIVTGPCSPMLHTFVMENYFLSNGATFSRNQANGLIASRPGLSIADQTIVPRAPHPSLKGGRFLGAFRVGYRRKEGRLLTDYVGLWNQRQRSVIMAFTSDPEGRFTKPRLVLTSHLPLRSASYFPAPDSPSGRLGLVQIDAGRTRLISLDWSHPGLFD